MPDPINLDDPVGKVAGRRRIRDAFAYGMKLQHAAGRMISPPSRPVFRKGVYRFRTFEEADEWMNRMWGIGRTSNPAPRSRTT